MSDRSRWFAPAAVLAVIALGSALQLRNGEIHPEALLLMTTALAVVAAASILPRPVRFARFDRRAVTALGMAGLILQFSQLFMAPPGFGNFEQADLLPFYRGLVPLVFIAASLPTESSLRSRRIQIGLIVALHFLLGVWIIRLTDNPYIDVHIFQHDAIQALRRGRDPYGLTFPDIYRGVQYYAPGLSVGGTLQFGFPYPPLSLLIAMPGQLLAGDHRYAQLVAVELSAVLMAFSRPTAFGPIAAVLFLTTPRIFFVLQQGWTEPFLVLGLAAVVFAACRSRRAVPWLYGAFIALKQYLVFAVPAGLLLLPWSATHRDGKRFFGIAGAVAFGITLPFVVWNPAGFWRSVVTLQFYQMFRQDSLSYPAWWVLQGHDPPSILLPFIAVLIACAIGVWRLPKTPGGFAGAVALTFFTFFAFNKQAFANYYFFVIGALAAALAGWDSAERTEEYGETVHIGETEQRRRTEDVA